MAGEEERLDHELLATLDRLAGRARHPALELDHFTDDLDDDPDLLGADDRQRATRRRACLMFAADLVVEQVLEDLTQIEWDADTGRPAPGTVEGSLVWTWFPPRFRPSYDWTFFHRVVVSAIKVAYDLARPDGAEAACTAEEMLRKVICDFAVDVMDDAGLGPGWSDLTEVLLEDLDFLDLYDQTMDGIEDDPATRRALARTAPPVDDWFTPFNDGRIVHPYAETEQTGPREHDLTLRVRGDQDAFERSRDAELIDDPAHVAPFPPASDAVEQARALEAAVGDAVGNRWVADSAAPQSSFADLAQLAGSAEERGSGWLTWEPHEGADMVRTDPVIELTPHRHFPVGADLPWVDVSFGGVLMSVPLTAVVAYRTDPEVRRRWTSAFPLPTEDPGKAGGAPAGD
jgi:hypothetical protein